MQQALRLLGGDAGDGNARPHGDDLRDVFGVYLRLVLFAFLFPVSFHALELVLELDLAVA